MPLYQQNEELRTKQANAVSKVLEGYTTIEAFKIAASEQAWRQ